MERSMMKNCQQIFNCLNNAPLFHFTFVLGFDIFKFILCYLITIVITYCFLLMLFVDVVDLVMLLTYFYVRTITYIQKVYTLYSNRYFFIFIIL